MSQEKKKKKMSECESWRGAIAGKKQSASDKRRRKRDMHCIGSCSDHSRVKGHFSSIPCRGRKLISCDSLSRFSCLNIVMVQLRASEHTSSSVRLERGKAAHCGERRRGFSSSCGGPRGRWPLRRSSFVSKELATIVRPPAARQGNAAPPAERRRAKLDRSPGRAAFANTDRLALRWLVVGH